MAVTRSSWDRAWWTTTARPCGRSASATPTPATWARSIPNGRACRSSSASSRVRKAAPCDWSTPSAARRSGRTTEPTVHVHSQGMCADILAEHPGQECYAGEAKGGDQAWMFTAQGKRIGNENIGSLAPLDALVGRRPAERDHPQGQADEVPGRDDFRSAGSRPPANGGRPAGRLARGTGHRRRRRTADLHHDDSRQRRVAPASCRTACTACTWPRTRWATTRRRSTRNPSPDDTRCEGSLDASEARTTRVPRNSNCRL